MLTLFLQFHEIVRGVKQFLIVLWIEMLAANVLNFADFGLLAHDFGFFALVLHLFLRFIDLLEPELFLVHKEVGRIKVRLILFLINQVPFLGQPLRICLISCFAGHLIALGVIFLAAIAALGLIGIEGRRFVA